MSDSLVPVLMMDAHGLASTGVTRDIVAPFSGRITGVKVLDTTALAASDTDFVTIELINLGAAGTGTRRMASRTTRAQGLNGLSANIPGSVTVRPSIPITALASGINPGFTAGTHLVKYAYVFNDGSIGPISESGVTRTTDASDAKITASLIASTSTGVKGINVYATKANATDVFYLVSAGEANATADVNVGALDAALTIAAESTPSNSMVEDLFFSAGDVLQLTVAFAASGAFTNGCVQVFGVAGR